MMNENLHAPDNDDRIVERSLFDSENFERFENWLERDLRKLVAKWSAWSTPRAERNTRHFRC